MSLLWNFMRAIAFKGAGPNDRIAVSEENPLPVSVVEGGAGGSSSAPASDIVSNKKTVSAAATPEALAASTACLWVYIESPDEDVPPGPFISANTGNVWVGADDGPPHKLAPGEGMGFAVADLSKIVVRVAVDGEGVVYTYGVE